MLTCRAWINKVLSETDTRKTLFEFRANNIGQRKEKKYLNLIKGSNLQKLESKVHLIKVLTYPINSSTLTYPQVVDRRYVANRNGVETSSSPASTQPRVRTDAALYTTRTQIV